MVLYDMESFQILLNISLRNGQYLAKEAGALEIQFHTNIFGRFLVV